jgi:hypothetical protein
MPKKGTRKAQSSSSIGPKSSPFESTTSGYKYPVASPHVSSSYDSTPRRPMRSLSGSSVNPNSSSKSLSSSSKSPLLAPVKLMPYVKPTTKNTSCKGKKIVECNKLTLSHEQIAMLISQVSDIYAGEQRLKYVIGRIRKTKCKFTPKYVGTFTGRKFTGEDMVYDQAMDKIQTFFKDGDKTVF